MRSKLDNLELKYVFIFVLSWYFKGNDDSDDTEDSHDEDEEEELGAEYSPSAPNPTEATNAIATVPTNPAPHHLPINNNDIVMNDSNINI